MKKKIMAAVIAATILLSACSNGKKENSRSGQDNGGETEKETTESVKDTVTHSGKYVVFGRYEQDGNAGNGPEPIEWEILSEKDGKMLLVSRYILDFQPYNTTRTDVSWETCSLREWLNNDFYFEAFSENEQAQIPTVTVPNPANAYYGTDCGNDTQDKVFCLNVQEIIDNYSFEEWDDEFLYGTSQAVLTGATKYAQTKHDYDNNGYFYWWLRSSGGHKDYVCCCDFYGRTGWTCIDRHVDSDGIGVRPAIYLSIQ